MLLPVTRLWPRTRSSTARRLLAVCVVLLTAAWARDARGLTLHQSYRFDASRLEVSGTGLTKMVRAGDLPRTWEAGQPQLPYDVVTLLVPRGSRVVGLRANAVAEHPVSEGVRLESAMPLENDRGELMAPKPLRRAGPGSVPAGGVGYPEMLAEPAGGGALHGYQMVSVRVYPVRYETTTGRLLVSERIDLDIDLAPGGSQPLERQRFSAAIEADARRSLERLIANTEAIPGYQRRIGQIVDKPRGGFEPTDAPSLEGSDVDYVIITTDALAPTWQTLADWKTRRGVPTVVRTVEWIQANYRHGSDVQETIRTFIKDAYAKWAVRWVLLAGDTDILPARYGWSNFGEPTERDIPTDMYFACLDGNWNLDGDAQWGEAAISVSNPGDSTDLYAEVYVGRLTASTVTKATNIINKILSYENPVQTAYQNKLLLLGEVLFPVDWDSGMSISMDGASFCEEMAGLAGACVTKKKLYENFYDYPGSFQLTLANTIAELNAGYGLVNHIGHGGRYNMSVGDRSLQNFDALALTNSDKRCVLYFLNCTATAFDFPCLAEAFLESNGGAVAVLGASRAAYALPSRNYNHGFFEAIYQNGYSHLGEIFVQSRLAQTTNAWYDTADHYSHFLYNFLGEPEMVMHSCQLGTTTASYPGGIGLGTTNVLVNVKVGGVDRQGALVCLQKGTEEYEFGTTDVAGNVTLAFRAESAGSVQVTVTGQNMTTHLGTITVSTGSTAYVRAQSVTIEDNTTPPSSGNSDGVLDAGETIELSALFNNSGNQTASSVTGKLRIPSPWATVLDSTYSLGTIVAGGNATATNQVYFQVPAATPDGTVLPLTFVSTNGVSTWTDVINKVVHAPRMELVRLKVDDFAPGGNGDGVIQAGETFDLLAYFKNYGTGAADGLGATLTSSDPDITIFTGSVSIGRADAMQEVTGATRFRLQEMTLQENPLTLQLTDSWARSLVLPITLRPPAQPATPALDASTGANIVVVSWTPSTDVDLAGYNVYRATDGSGPWTRATLDHTVRVAYLRDAGLLPQTRYYYYVTSLDTSGNESPASGISSINTQVGQLNGWPIALASTSSCPPAVGDITGDGSREIVAGNSHLYAWNWNGIELRDDDGDPQSWGVFSVEVSTVTGAVALAEIDQSSPGLEVFVSTWDDSNKCFAVRGDGSMVTGWPQKPDPTSNPRGYWADCSAIDLDGDGRAELFAPGKNGNLYAWHWNGAPLGASAAFKSGLGTWTRSSPSFADLDGDGHREIVYGTVNGVLNVWKADGSNYRSFPKTPGSLCLSNTAIGDVNKDGKLDIVMITEGGQVHVYNSYTGNELPGWPQSVLVSSNPKTPSPALADFDGDRYLEIVVALNYGGGGTVAVYNYQGVVQSGWPKNLSNTSESSPIVADVSGDGMPDILFGNEGGLLYGWDKNGNDLAGFPLTVGDFIRSVPFACDVDGDGGIDLVLSGWDKNVYIWDFPVPYSKSAAQWPTIKHDAERSSYYWNYGSSPSDAEPDREPASLPPARAFLGQNVPNPFNPVTSIAYGVPGTAGSRQQVSLDVFDVHGRLVRQLLRGQQAPGTYKAMWDGRNDRGAQVQSGVYFYRLQVAGQMVTRKMLMLK